MRRGSVKNGFDAPAIPAIPDRRCRMVEQIPLAETRNYVQRIMENLQVTARGRGGDKAPDRSRICVAAPGNSNNHNQALQTFDLRN